MTRDEANAQVEALARRIGIRTPALPVRTVIHEAFLGFEYAPAEQALSVVAPIYRFRAEPRPGVLEAVLAAATSENTGGGRLVVEGGNAVVLRRDFVEPTSDRRFAEDVDVFARAGLRWVQELFPQAAERANRPPGPDPRKL